MSFIFYRRFSLKSVHANPYMQIARCLVRNRKPLTRKRLTVTEDLDFKRLLAILTVSTGINFDLIDKASPKVT